MACKSDYVEAACNCCLHAHQDKNGYWYCSSHKDNYFPDAPWDGEDEFSPTSCPSFKPDKGAIPRDEWVW